MSTENTNDPIATEGCAAAAGYADDVVTAIEKLEGSNGPLEYETRLLLSLAKEAQQTGRMPDLSILLPKPVCPECNGLGGCYIGDPCHGTEGWQPCACERHTSDYPHQISS
jgi:hypothetical protein